MATIDLDLGRLNEMIVAALKDDRLDEVSRLIVGQLKEIYAALKEMRGAIDASGTAVMREIAALTTHLKESRAVWKPSSGIGATAQAIRDWDVREQKKKQKQRKRKPARRKARV